MTGFRNALNGSLASLYLFLFENVFRLFGTLDTLV